MDEMFVDGSTWLARLVPFLPPGKTFFELDLSEQRRVLEENGSTLTGAEREAMLAVAPEEVVDVLRAVLASLPLRADESPVE